jgi:hypothetical protein
MHIKDMQLKTQPSSLDTASIQYPLSIYGPVLRFFLKSRLVLGLELRETNQTKPNQTSCCLFLEAMAMENYASRNIDKIHTDVLSQSRQACYKVLSYLSISPVLFAFLFCLFKIEKSRKLLFLVKTTKGLDVCCI